MFYISRNQERAGELSLTIGEGTGLVPPPKPVTRAQDRGGGLKRSRLGVGSTHTSKGYDGEQISLELKAVV